LKTKFSKEQENASQPIKIYGVFSDFTPHDLDAIFKQFSTAAGNDVIELQNIKNLFLLTLAHQAR
jgi:hypothetical protein